MVENFACTACGCVCDDLRVTVSGDRIVLAEEACVLAEPWLLGQNREFPLSDQEVLHDIQKSVSELAEVRGA